MVAAVSQPPRPPAPDDGADQRVFFYGKTFDDFEKLLDIRGERGSPRLYYLRGTIELMSPSVDHEGIKSTIGRLVEAAADELGFDVNAYGSWTLKHRPEERGAEPDECYVVGGARKAQPDLAIEVEWSRGGLDKLEIYRGLGVREVWIWAQSTRAIEVHVLRGDRYESAVTSEALPQVDLALLAKYVLVENQSEAVRAYRSALRQNR